MIESIQNEKVKYWSKLNIKKYQDKYGLFIVEGLHLVEEARKTGFLVEVIVANEYKYDFERTFCVNEKVMRKITMLDNPPQIIGIVKKSLFNNKINYEGNILLLDHISNPGNLGTIIRSAVAFNVNTIILSEGSVSIYNPKVLRATEGLIFKINIIESNLQNFIFSLKERGYKIYSTDVLDGTNLKRIKFPSKTAVVMGNEGSGVSKEIHDIVDDKIFINMSSECESLNVGIATSIILYELYN